MRIGVCKECLEDVPMISRNEVAKEIWECEHCYYPNDLYFYPFL
jgi:ribosomal protein L37AE/L43A